MKKTIIFAAAALVAGCFHGGEKTDGGQASASSDGGDVVAVVNGAEISAARITAYAPAAAGLDRETILDNIISGELVAQAARDAGMHLRPEIAEQLHIAEQTVLGRVYTREFIDGNPVPEETVSLRYEELKAEFAGQNEYRTAHILVDDEELAKDLHAQIAADGAKFDDLAREHSKDAGSAARGGDLGWADPRSLVPEYAAAMEQTAPGALAAAPVRSQFGWHVIRVDEKRPLAIPPLNDEMRSGIEQSVRAEMFSAHLDELRAAADIVRN